MKQIFLWTAFLLMVITFILVVITTEKVDGILKNVTPNYTIPSIGHSFEFTDTTYFNQPDSIILSMSDTVWLSIQDSTTWVYVSHNHCKEQK